MKLSTTLLLLVLVGGLITFIYTHERNELTTKERLAAGSKPFNFKPEEVDGVDIVLKDKTMKLRRTGPTWEIDGSVDDRANPEMVQTLVTGIAALEWLDTVDRANFKKDDLKRTGLGSSAIEVIVRKGKDRVAVCRFGAEAPIEGSVYVNTSENKDDVHLAVTDVAGLLHKTPDEWRDPKLVRLKAEAVRRFVLSAGNGAIEFVREPGKQWEIIKPLRSRASDERVNAVLASVLNLEATPTKDPVPPGGAALPQMRILVEAVGLEKPLEILLHPGTEDEAPVPVEVTGRPGLFLAPKKAHDYWSLQPSHLRDQNLASIVAEEVKSLRLRSQKYGEVLMEKQGADWMLKRFGKTEPANVERIKLLFDNLNIEQVREFVTDAASDLTPYGLNNPFLEIEWKTADKTNTLRFGLGKEGLVFAYYVGEPFIYRVGASVLTSIPPELTRWRGLKIINASLFAVQRIILTQGSAPPMTLHYNPEQASWKAEVGGKDVTDRLNTARANQLLQRIVSFEAADWSADRSIAYQALKDPSLNVQLILGEPGNADAPTKAISLQLAPTVPGRETAVYHGKLEDDPDTFLITKDVYQDLLIPLIK